MAVQTPPTIDPVPTPAIQRGDRATFSSRVDAFVLWLVNAVTQFQASVSNVHNNATEAVTAANAALGYKETTLGYRDAASGYAATTLGYRNTTLTYRDETLGYRDQALATATSLTATSTTSNTVGTGAKTFTVQAGKQFVANIDIKVVDAGNPTNAMFGTVTSYSGTNLVVNVVSSTGSGTIANWNVSVAGQRGASGPPGGSGTVYSKGNSGTTAQTVSHLDGEAQTLVATGNFTLGASNFPTGQFTITILRLTNGGAFTMSSTGIQWIKADRSTTAVFSEVGITLQVSGVNNIALFSYGDGTVYGKVL